jgi:DNA-binding PadR family transcriptional regulator
MNPHIHHHPHHPAEHPDPAEFRFGRRHHRRGPFGPGPFGPGAFGGPPSDEPGGRGRRGHPGRGRGRGRAQRGDVRTATLLLLAEQPMHGYQLMQAISERTSGAWEPSPGAIYPTLSQLQDEGLVTMQSEGGRKLATLSDAGRTFLDEHGAELPDPFADFPADAGKGFRLRDAIEGIAVAMTQIVRTGSETQLLAAQKVLADAQRSLYLILADGPSNENGDTAGGNTASGDSGPTD